mgnify:CR=1 FL=1
MQTMQSILLSLGLGFLIASPQLIMSLRYWPQSRRARQGYADKVAVGNSSWKSLLHGLFLPRTKQWLDGVYYTEYCCYVGYVGLLTACVAPLSYWHGVLLLAILLAMGKHTPLFHWTAWLHLRIPARYCYFINLSLAMLAIHGYIYLSTILTVTQLGILLALQVWDLAMNVSQLMPMNPYCQRWERPSRAFQTPLTRWLTSRAFGKRVSGLPYPLRTGQVNRIRTLGYNGGSQAQWMADLRDDPNPLGSGAHDWFSLAEDSSKLDWYGVKYAYTYRPLKLPKWEPTPIPHLYRNRYVCHTIPEWDALRSDWHTV